MHPAKNVSDLTSVLQDFFEGFAIGSIPPKVPVDQVPIELEESSDFRARSEVPPLRVEEESHQALRVLFEDFIVLRVDEATSRVESVKDFIVRRLPCEKVKDGNPLGIIPHDF